jgi:mannose-1-phosphate guanylyltransferase
MVTKVAEPSAYGVVVTKPNSTVIDRFVEKPVQFVGNRINAGIYMFNPSVLDRIEVSFSAFLLLSRYWIMKSDGISGEGGSR